MSNTTTGQPKDDRDYAWHRHPALLAGIPAVAAVVASVLTIVLGQAGALPQSINPAPPTTTVTSTVTSTATSTVTTTMTATAGSTDRPSGSPAAGGAGTLVWKENVKVPDDYGVNIDQPGPVVNQDLLTIEVREFRPIGGVPYAQLGLSAEAGVLAPGTPATYEDCLSALGTDAQPESFPAGKGTAFCVRSGEPVNPHIGLFRVQSWNTTTGRVELEVTVWTTS
ncbi:hypothetical protein [Kribbella sp. NPDC003557]|uniref:hypothetical protein n=1 Tax=Kribbella sp. NPDC003557 TaxID=3154449 RepID=UPI0033A48878